MTLFGFSHYYGLGNNRLGNNGLGNNGEVATSAWISAIYRADPLNEQ